LNIDKITTNVKARLTLEIKTRYFFEKPRHEEGILAYFDLRIDNGIVEAMSYNAKAISHRARGYRSETTFSLAMIHGL